MNSNDDNFPATLTYKGIEFPFIAVSYARDILNGKYGYSVKEYRRAHYIRDVTEEDIYVAIRYVLHQEAKERDEKEKGLTDLQRRMLLLESSLEFAKENERLSMRIHAIKPDDPMAQTLVDSAWAYTRQIKRQIDMELVI